MAMNTAKVILSTFGPLLLTANVAQAAFITLNDTRMDEIFSQPNFGSNPIDIRFVPETELVAPELLDLTTEGQIFDLFGEHIGP